MSWGYKASRKARDRTLPMWYEEFGPVCAYCQKVMLSIEEAREIGDRNRPDNQHLWTKEERRLPPDFPTIDHVLAASAGGRNMLTNYVVCCNDCNQKKQDKEQIVPHQFRSRWLRKIQEHNIKYGSTPPNHLGEHPT